MKILIQMYETSLFVLIHETFASVKSKILISHLCDILKQERERC
jgi:hypothetical protein